MGYEGITMSDSSLSNRTFLTLHVLFPEFHLALFSKSGPKSVSCYAQIDRAPNSLARIAGVSKDQATRTHVFSIGLKWTARQRACSQSSMMPLPKAMFGRVLRQVISSSRLSFRVVAELKQVGNFDLLLRRRRFRLDIPNLSKKVLGKERVRERLESLHHRQRCFQARSKAGTKGIVRWPQRI